MNAFPNLGRLMQREVVAVPSHWTVGQTIDFMRTDQALPESFQEIYVVAAGNRLEDLRRAVRA